MSDTEQHVNEPGVCRARKRARDIQNWAQNIAKRKRNSGEAYVSRTTRREVPTRSIGIPCRDGCFDKITQPIVNEIHKEFWEIRDFALQNSYIQKSVRDETRERERERDK